MPGNAVITIDEGKELAGSLGAAFGVVSYYGRYRRDSWLAELLDLYGDVAQWVHDGLPAPSWLEPRKPTQTKVIKADKNVTPDPWYYPDPWY